MQFNLKAAVTVFAIPSAGLLALIASVKWMRFALDTWGMPTGLLVWFFTFLTVVSVAIGFVSRR